MSSLAKEVFYKHVKRRNTNVYPIALAPGFVSDADSIYVSGNATLVTDSSGVRARQTTGVALGATNLVNGDSMYTRMLNVSMYFRFKLLQTTCRMFIGLADGNPLSSTSPGGNFAGLLFNENSGNLFFATNDGTTMNTTSLGAIDFGVHDFYMWLFKSGGGNRIAFQLDDGSRLGTTLKMPTNSTFMAYFSGIRTNTALARSLEIGKMHISQES